MSRRFNDFSIIDKSGERVSVKDCTIDPLNLLIPGRASLVVPKYPKKKKEKGPSPPKQGRLGINVVTPISDDEDVGTGYEGDQEEIAPLIEKKKTKATPPRKMRAKMKGGDDHDDHDAVIKKPKDKQKSSNSDSGSASNTHRHEQHYETRDKKDKAKLQARTDKQQAYIARLRAKYQAKYRDAAHSQEGEAKKAQNSDDTTGKKTRHHQAANDAAAAAADDYSTYCTSAGSTSVATSNDTNNSDDTERMTELLRKHLKIQAAGTDDNDEKPATPGGSSTNDFTPSDDMQLLVRKKNNESWKDIVAAMGRSKKQLQKRFKELQDQGIKAPSSSDEGDKSERNGATTTDTETGGGDTTTGGEGSGGGGGGETAMEDTSDKKKQKKTQENKDGEGGDGDSDATAGAGLDMGALFGALEAIAENATINPATAAPASPPTVSTDQRGKKGDDNTANNERKNKSGDGGKTKGAENNKKQAKVQDPKETNTDKATETAAGDQDVDDDDGGINAYIAMYAHHLLVEANAGRAHIPEPDENFDENDCILLALMALHRQQNHWFDIQADFANLTGRLVPEDVLKCKLSNLSV